MRDQLTTLAERALAFCDGEAQVTAWWERQLTGAAGGAITTEATSVEIAVLRDGRVGTAVTTVVDDDGLAAAAAGAARVAPSGPAASEDLPDPLAGRAHDGFDASVLALDPADFVLGEWASWRAAAARTLVASTRGVRAYEERSFGDVRVRRPRAGRSLELAMTAVRPGDLDGAALAGEADALLGAGDELVTVSPGEYPVVLGPWAVAEVLRRAAVAFGGPESPLGARLGTRVAAPEINLSDSPRFAATLPRAFDATGVPRQPLPLIQDGVAHRFAGPGTGHALAPGGIGGTLPEHLVLVGGGAAGLAELAAPIEVGLLIPSLAVHGGWAAGERGSALAEGVSVIRGGEIDAPAPNLTVLFEPLELLATAQALTARQRTIPPPVQRSARTASATVCPGARFAGGLFVA
jgi:predicted Zn-dependent protease